MMFQHIPKERFHTQYAVVFDRIFGDRSVSVQSFRDRRWKALLLPYGFNLRAEDFNAFHQAVQASDPIVIITDIETIPPHGHSIMLELSSDSWQQARCDKVLGHVDAAVFGMSASWGMLISIDDYAVIGGSTPFVDNFLELLGGESEVRESFMRFCKTEWSVSAELRDKLLRSVKW